MAPLATLAQVRARLGLAVAFTSDDAWLTAELTAVSDDIERYCDRVLRRATTTLVLDGPETSSLWLDKYAPIESVTSIKESADRDWAGTDALTADTDYLVYAAAGRIERLYTWLQGRQVIQVVFVGGYVTPDGSPTGAQTALPDAIVGAAIYETVVRYRNRGHEGQRSEAGEGGSMTLYEHGGLSQGTRERLRPFVRVGIAR